MLDINLYPGFIIRAIILQITSITKLVGKELAIVHCVFDDVMYRRSRLNVGRLVQGSSGG